jgi:transcription-repair coupling factor (superfamily II helicase)
MTPFLTALGPGARLDGLAGSAPAWALPRVVPSGPATLVVADAGRLDRTVRALRFFAPDREVLAYPADDGHPWDGGVRDPERTLARLLARASTDAVVVAEAAALLLRVPALVRRTVVVGERVEPQALLRWFVAAGYLVAPHVAAPGTVALRGGTLEAWGPGNARPTRVSWFDDEIDGVRGPATLLAAREALLDAEAAERAAAYVHAVANERGPPLPDRRPLLSDLRAGVWFASAEDYLPALGEVAPVDLPGPWFVLEPDQVAAALERAHLDVLRRFDALPPTERPLVRPDDRYAPPEAWAARLEVATALTALGRTWQTRPVSGLRVGPTGDLEPTVVALRRMAREGAAVVLVADDAARAERIRALFAGHGLTLGDTPARHTVALQVGELDEGFVAEDLAWVTADEVFGEKLRDRPASALAKFRKAAAGSLGTLNRGDLVVHARHGIGVYRGLSRMPLGESAGDFVLLEYRDGERLYVPVWRLDLVAPYCAEGEGQPRLDRLGGSTWEVRRARVKDAVLKLAAEILRIHARRKLATATSYDEPSELFTRFEEAFPWVETDDQREAIAAVLADLAAGAPMDRLVVGDVGFGKTEVAMRAAFRVALRGHQVLVLVPTTVLAFQHHATFRQRMGEFGVRVEMLSRFVDAATSRRVHAEVTSGGVDVLVATTAALGRAVRFNRLGLVVVDEEHRFGTRQKEEARRVAEGVHYLALSATPIPRSLHMALAGLRNISLIATPPEGRRPIHTEVVRFGAERIREEVLAEVARGGQVYFVHNRVQSIEGVARWLRKQLPGVRVDVGHGQLAPDALERVLGRFAGHETDVLVCTTIIESGVDLPNANLMIINRAEQFGAAQLYQLRGRVGRSNRLARCILLVGGTGLVRKEALSRLQGLQQASALGSGFGVASRDLELRGGGEILGEKQHGHIAAIGFDAYIELLEEATAQVRGEVVAEVIDPEVEVPVPAVLPEAWIADTAERLDAYGRVAQAPTAVRVQRVFADLEARYGPVPDEAGNFRALAELRLRCRELGIAKLAVLKVRLALVLDPHHRLDPMRLVELCSREGARFRRSGEMGLDVRGTPEETADPFRFAAWALGRLAGPPG